MEGVKIGSGSLVGAGALVPEGKEIPDGVLVVGAPAKIVRTLSNEERDNLAKIAEIYVKRAERYRRELRLLPQNFSKNTAELLTMLLYVDLATMVLMVCLPLDSWLPA